MEISNEHFEVLKEAYEDALKEAEQDKEIVTHHMTIYIKQFLDVSEYIADLKEKIQDLIDNAESDEEDDEA